MRAIQCRETERLVARRERSDVRGPAQSGTAADARWRPIGSDGLREPLAFDHTEVLATATDRLHSKDEYTSLLAFLLPDEFTLVDLQRVYEIGLGSSVNKSALQERARPKIGIPTLAESRTAPNRSGDDPGGVVELAPRASARSPLRNKPDRGAALPREGASAPVCPLVQGPRTSGLSDARPGSPIAAAQRGRTARSTPSRYRFAANRCD